MTKQTKAAKEVAQTNPAQTAPETGLQTIPNVTGLGVLAPEDFRDFTTDWTDEDTGEVIRVPKFNYIEGMPQQWRFDAKNGGFSINGKKPLGDEIRIQPIAWRFFEGEILGMPLKKWVELYFVDPTSGNVSGLLLHSHSIDGLLQLQEDLFYDRVTLADVILIIKQKQIVAEKVQGKPKFYIAEFDFEVADKDETRLLKRYAKLVRLFRRQATNAACVTTASHNYYDIYSAVEAGQLSETTED